jgi:hypothetical protein
MHHRPRCSRRQSCKLFVLCLTIAILAGVPAAAQNGQTIVPTDDPFYTRLRSLYLEQGRSPPSTATPYSADEAQRALARIRPDQLSQAGREVYESLLEHLGSRVLYHEDGFLAFNAGLEVSLEAYLNTNEEQVSPDAWAQRSDAYDLWQHGYEERLPFLTIPLEAWIGGGFYAAAELTARTERRAFIPRTEDQRLNPTNVPVDLRSLDLYLPFRTFLSLGGSHWNLQFGRDRISWGYGSSGNMAVSGIADFHDFLRFSTYWSIFKFTAAYIVAEPWLTPAESSMWKDEERAGWYPNRNEEYKAFYGHRLEARFFDRVNLSLTELIVFGNKYPELLKDLNPIMIFHNWYYEERANDSMALEIEVNPWKMLTLYGQYYMDDFQTPYELEEGSGGRPGAAGYIAGVHGVFPLWKGYLSGVGEWALTDPWLYNRWHPLTKFTHRRRLWSYLPPDGYYYVDKPLGYRHGPDANVWYASIGYDAPQLFGVSLNYTELHKGEITTETLYEVSREASQLATPTGVVERQQVLHFAGKARVVGDVWAGGHVYWIRRANAGHQAGMTSGDVELAVFLKASL